MQQFFLDLLKGITKVLGYGSIIIGAVVLIWKQILQPIYNRYLDFKLEKAKSHEKSILDAQDKVLSKRLELETIKLNRVLPLLEEINLLIATHRMMFTTFVSTCIDNGCLREDFEKARLELDTKIIDAIYKISIYLPTEIRILLTEIRLIISCSWKEPKTVHGNIRASVFNKKEITIRSSALYAKYHECLYDMISNYCFIGDKDISYNEILKKYGFNEGGQIEDEELIDKFIRMYLLFHEYPSKELVDCVMAQAFEK